MGDIVTLPDGREAVVYMQSEDCRIGERVARAGGALHWGLPNKALCEAVAMRAPDWPDGVWAWVVTRLPIAPLTFPGHDEGPLVMLDQVSGQPRGRWPAAAEPWEALL